MHLWLSHDDVWLVGWGGRREGVQEGGTCASMAEP